MSGLLSTEQDFTELYRATARDLLVFFTRRTFDAHVALDLTSETFAQALASRATFRGADHDAARAWLFAIGRRQLARYFDRGVVDARLSRRLAGGMVSAGDADIARIEELAALDGARVVLREHLAALDLGQREALWLRVVEEQPYAAVARRLGTTEQTARKRVSRALRILSADPLLVAAIEAGGLGDGRD